LVAERALVWIVVGPWNRPRARFVAILVEEGDLDIPATGVFGRRGMGSVAGDAGHAAVAGRSLSR
ncbi:MAG: hypothetical protein P8Y44_11045, partial [Acidobacteriota bacterium]